MTSFERQSVIQFAGVDLLLPDNEGRLAECLDRCDLNRLSLFGREPMAVAIDGRNNPRSSWEPEVCLPTPNYPAPPPLSLNRLYWPTGATRWATFVGLVNREGLDRILQGTLSAVGGNSANAKQFTPQRLDIASSDVIGPHAEGFNTSNDGTQYSLSVQMHLLPPRPVSLFDGYVGESLWLVPLVDDRYWWQFKKMPTRLDWVLSQDNSDIFGNNTPTANGLKEDWRGWFRILSFALGLWRDGYDNSIEVLGDKCSKQLSDRLKETYFFPDRNELDRIAYNAAVLLDAVAYSCGRRIVRHPDGVTRAYSWEGSQYFHSNNLIAYRATGGGPITTAVDKLAKGMSDSVDGTPDIALTQAHPEFVDVTFRKLAEWDEQSTWPAENDFANPGRASGVPSYFDSRVFYGPGVRTIRNSGAVAYPLKTYQPGAVKTIHTPSWVGRIWYDDGARIDSEPPGLIDLSTYGDRYFSLAYRIGRDFYEWQSQQHEYQFSRFEFWNPTGYDDAVEWDAGRGITHVRSMPPDVGVSSMLVQLHRQCVFQPDRFVGIISGPWTLHPKELEPITSLYPPDADCAYQTTDGPSKPLWLDPCDIGFETDYFPNSWEWISAPARPLIPTDPHAQETSIEYGKAMAWLGDPVTVTVRSHKLVQQLKNDLGCAIMRDGDGNPILDANGNVIFERTGCLTTANGFVMAHRHGCEWLVDSIDCN